MNRKITISAIALLSIVVACEGVVAEGEGEGDVGEGEGEGAQGEGEGEEGEGEGEGEGEDGADNPVCIKSQECAGEEDPEEACRIAFQDCLDDPDCAALQEACRAEVSALVVCLDANGTCDDVDGVPVFGAEATGDAGACADEQETVVDCFNDAA